jgi:sporulation protein YlmC with PRC-barrel domain
MNKTMSAIALALLLGAAPMAYAQTAQHPNSMNTQTTNANRAEETIQADQIRASKMIGSSVYDVQNRNIGKVRDLVLDKDGKIAAVVVDVGTFLGMGGKLVAIGLNDIKTDNNRLTLDMTKDQLKAAPAFKYRDTESTGSSTPAKGHLTRQHR